MADSEPAPWLQRPAVQSIADSTGGTAITVHRGDWAQFAPALPAEDAAMVAPPITVSSAPVANVTATAPEADRATMERRCAELTRYRMNMPALSPSDAQNGRHRRTARTP
jgi:hypothetical protein